MAEQKEELMKSNEIKHIYENIVKDAVEAKRIEWEKKIQECVPLTMRELHQNVKHIHSDIEQKLRFYFDYNEHFIGSPVQQKT